MPAVLTATLDVSALNRRTREFIARFPGVMSRAMATSAQSILVPEIMRHIRANRSVFLGRLIANIRVTSIAGPNPTIEVGSVGVPYAANVELGTGPRPIDAAEFARLVDYARIKNGVPFPYNYNVAAAIANYIETLGNDEHPFIIPAWTLVRNAWIRDVLARVRAAMP